MRNSRKELNGSPRFSGRFLLAHSSSQGAQLTGRIQEDRNFNDSKDRDFRVYFAKRPLKRKNAQSTSKCSPHTPICTNTHRMHTNACQYGATYNDIQQHTTI